MERPEFDAMLKTALEEAIRRDAAASPAPPRLSRRQRKRMGRLLADPWGAARREEREEARPLRRPARWLAAAVAAALLTGTAAGLALGGGELIRQIFEGKSWAAEHYGGAADTEQLLGLGAELDAAVVESGGVRLELLDAISDGQVAKVALRVTVLDPAAQERLQETGGAFFGRRTEVLLEDDRKIDSLGYSSGSSEDGTYSVLLTFRDEALEQGGQCSIRLRDLETIDLEQGHERETVLSGEWVLSVTLRPTEVIRLEPGALCRVSGDDWILDSVTLSPLALRLTFHREGEGRRTSRWVPYKDLSIRLKNGEVLDMEGCSLNGGYGGRHIKASYEFPIPLDLDQVDCLQIRGTEIPLTG